MPYRRSRTGFTLIELLVVLVIISIMTGLTLFSASQLRHGRRALSAALNIQRVFALAQAQAILKNQVLKMVIEPHQYAFYRFEHRFSSAEKLSLPVWVKLSGHTALSAQKVSSGISMQVLLTPKSRAAKGSVVIWIYPTGVYTPFMLNIKTSTLVYQVQGNGAALLTVTQAQKV